jgi:hypothetical protein
MKTNFSITSTSVTLRSLWLAVLVLALSALSPAQFRVAVTFGPPALPVYEQPVCPGDGYIWTPGYWGWDDDADDYYWVPGTWVLAPEVGFLWTPGWWGWGGASFTFHEGFWGPEVGFYGGINYGFGYFGEGYEGGRWDNGHFFYNRAVNNVNVTVVRNVYNTTVNVRNENRVSFNGGNGGINARASAREEAAARARHVPPVAVQTQHVQAARSNRELRASVNQGRPPVAATARPGEFSGHSVVPAKAAGAPYHPPANRGGEQRGNAQPAASEANRPENNRVENNRPENGGSRPANIVHPKDIPPAEHRAAPNTGNAQRDQKYQKQQEKLNSQQETQRQKLQQRQDQEHQKYTQQKANDTRTQQLEQKHQQQTQQLQQKHTAQQQHMEQRQQPAHASNSKPPKGK